MSMRVASPEGKACAWGTKSLLEGLFYRLWREAINYGKNQNEAVEEKTQDKRAYDRTYTKKVEARVKP